MVIPTFIFFLFFYFIPFLKGFYYGFFEWTGYSNVKKFVGLDNYKKLFQDEYIWNALLHNLFFLIWVSLFIFILSLFFAVAITRFNLRESKFYRILFFMPYVLPQIAVSMLWLMVFNPFMGILNGLLSFLGLENLQHAWLGDPKTVLPSLVVPIVWASTGFFMVLLISGIQNIPTSLFEAAEIDGASEFYQLKNITLPLLWEIIQNMFLFFMSTAIAGTFTYVNIMTGMNNRDAEVITTKMYNESFTNYNFGYGTAIGALIFVISLASALILRKVTKRESVEF